MKLSFHISIINSHVFKNQRKTFDSQSQFVIHLRKISLIGSFTTYPTVQNTTNVH